MELTPIHGDEVDGAALRAIVRRFRAHHAWRLERTAARLVTRHRRVLEALPMLYHRNHPALPGYAGAGVPQGIARYRPGPAKFRTLRFVAPTYADPRLPPARSDIHALFLMGSGGTTGQSRGSDIDLWVCCDTLLHSALWPKVRLIDQWAADLGLELHTFLVDPDALRARRWLPGSRMPMLVLDEFYRTGALMAGRYPLWWVVPHDDPVAYTATARRLLHQRFVPADAVVDFGPVGPFQPDELARGALTELGRALITPHKSLLKLMLMEAYAESPELGNVSSAYRALVHMGRCDPLELDSYLLMYDHVERHIRSAGREQELPFARSLLVGKTAENISVHPDLLGASEESQALLARFQAWGFDTADVLRFRDLDKWSMSQRLTEHERIMNALERGVSTVQSLLNLAASQVRAVTPDTDELQLHWLNETRLRQIGAAVRRMRPQDDRTLPSLHPALIGKRRILTLQLGCEHGRWQVREAGSTVRDCRRLVEAVVWAALNGASLVPAASAIHVSELLAQVQQGFRGEEGFREKAEEKHARYVFVNAESPQHLAMPRPTDGNPLHLETLDLVSQDAEGHWQLESLSDQDAVLDGLGRMLATPPETVSWQVPGGRERFLLARRLEQLHALAWRILQASGALFILPFGSGTVTVRQLPDTVETRYHHSVAELQTYLQSTGCDTVGVDPESQRLKSLIDLEAS